MNAAQMQSLGEVVGPKLPPVEYRFGGWSSANPIPTVDRVVGRTRQEIEVKIGVLLQSRATMKEYLSLKYVENDMHGVQDAASDIRDIDAELVGLRWVLGEA
jgi:hypothetical protein